MSINSSELTLVTLWRLSSELEEDFRQQLEAAVADCKQRPSLAEKREVCLKLTITPHPQDPDDVLIAPVTTRKTPCRKIQAVRARRTSRNQLQFDWNPDGDEEGET
jgi:hypothetical protein